MLIERTERKQMILQRSRVTSLKILCSVNSIKLMSQIASGGFLGGHFIGDNYNAICMSLGT